MSTPLTSVRNIGPAMEDSFRAAGITSAETLRDLGPDAAYAKLIAAGSRPHFIAYYALVMGLQGRPWNDCQGAEKAALRERFDALTSRIPAAGESALIRALDEVGVLVDGLESEELLSR